MGGLVDDVRYAFRGMRSAPVFTAVAIGCLAIGIAVNAGAFSVLDALLVRDLPGVVRQRELAAVLVSREESFGWTSPAHLSTVDWDAFRGAVPGFSTSAVAGTAPVALRLPAGARAVRAEFVSGDFFTMLGARPRIGRLLGPSDDVAGAPPAAVIGHDVWMRELGGRADVVGQPVYIGDAAFTVVGVAPEGFVGLYPGELNDDPTQGAPYLYVSVAAAPLARTASRYASEAAALDDRWLRLVGRRRPGVRFADIEAQTRTIAAAIAATHPRERKKMSAVVRLPNTASVSEMLAGVGFAMAVPLLVLLVACANLANQLLARGVQRGREIAVRLSLGATRRRMVRLLLVESTMLAVVASAVGIGLSRLMLNALHAFALVIPFRIPMDLRVVLFTTSLAFVTALAFGLVPALRATRVDLAQSIRDGGKASGYRPSRLRSALVVTQVAASVALLALAGVFVRGSQRSRASETEDNARRLITMSVDLDLLGYTPAAGRDFQARVMERLRALPGVEAVALAPFAPAGSMADVRVSLPGDAADRRRWLDVGHVSGDWFTARGTRATRGRLFTEGELRDDAPVSVVDEAAARQLWPAAGALGQTLKVGEGAAALTTTVVGVIPTIPDPHMHGDDGAVIVPGTRRYDAQGVFHVRTRGDAAGLRAAMQSVVRDIDARLPTPAPLTLGETLDDLGSGASQLASAMAAMGTLALLLAALGLSSLLAFIVEQRRYEIGVRMALGAESRAVTRMVVAQSMRLAVAGLAIGAVAAALAATGLRGILFGLPPIDPLAFGGSTVVILLVALLSSAAPARRAATVDPLVALRSE